MHKENIVVTCPPCGEQPLAPEGFNPGVAVATKMGFLNKESVLTTPHRPYGALPPQVGKLTVRGFTLIELLVVVLIIGILAAVAVPQYQKAVEKSRATQVLSALRAIQQAEEVYYLANGNYTRNIEELDISVTMPSGWTLLLMKDNLEKVTAYRSQTGISIIIYFNHTTVTPYPGKAYCATNKTNTQGIRICQAIGQAETLHSGDDMRFYI